MFNLEMPVFDGNTKEWRLMNLSTGTVYSSAFATETEAMEAPNDNNATRVNRRGVRHVVNGILEDQGGHDLLTLWANLLRFPVSPVEVYKWATVRSDESVWNGLTCYVREIDLATATALVEFSDDGPTRRIKLAYLSI